MKTAILGFTLCLTSLVHAQTPTITSVVDSAAGDTRLAPGSLATINGTNLGTSTSIAVTVGGKAAAVLTATGTQLKIHVPVDAATGATTVVAGGSAPFSTALFSFAPKFISVDGTGRGTVSAFHGIFGSAVTAADPALPGTQITILAIGLGPTDPVVPTGTPAPNGPFANTTTAPTLSIGPIPATVQFTQLRPGLIGTYQITLQVPNGVQSGDQNVSMSIGGSPAGQVTIPVGATSSGNTPTITSVVETASFSGRLAPGSLAYVNGTNFGNNRSIAVTVGGKAAFVVNATNTQLTILIPTAAAVGSNLVIVGASQSFNITLTQYAPVLISADGTGRGNIQAIHATGGAPVTAANPAQANERITVFAIGLGPTNPVVADGTPSPTNPLAVTTATPGASLGGQGVGNLSASLAPGLIGVYQISFNMASTVTNGNPNFTMSIPQGVNSAGPSPPLTLPVGAPVFTGPTVSSVVNSASNAVAGQPNAGVAQGSIFVAYGNVMGPAALVVAPGYPWPTTLSGTSATVTVGGQTVNLLLYYTSATQIAGLLPSNTPVGNGTIRVTYNGTQGTGSPITVVQNNLGVYTVNQAGSGPGIVTFADYSLVTYAKAANPGETLIIWATGLGPVSGNEAAGALPGDMPNIPVKLWIGDLAANVVYRGRSGCCVGEDQIAFVVPAGVVGCNVPMLLQINNQVSNASTMSIAASGRSCVPSPDFKSVLDILGNKTEQRVGFIDIGRETGPDQNSMISTSDRVESFFFKATTTPLQLAIAFDDRPPNTCRVEISIGNGGGDDDAGFPYTILDAGTTLTITGSNGTRTVTKGSEGGFDATIGNGSPGNFLDPGTYTVTTAGGADIGRISTTLLMPPVPTISNQASLNTITRANGLTVSWTGGDPKGVMTITGGSSVFNPNGPGVNVDFSCTTPVAAGTFTVPSYILLSLPAGQFGRFGINSDSAIGTFTATGLDLGIVASHHRSEIFVTYR